MKTKEKAQKLVEKIYEITGMYLTCKDVAVFLVDEKIETVHDICNLKNGMSKQELVYLSELQGLKQEINKS